MQKPQQRVRRDRKGFLVGVRLDKGDGHKRISRGKDFVVVGGAKEGHEHLRETVAAMSDEVKQRGKDVAEVQREEFREIFEKVREKLGPPPPPE
jgi:uncharacterized protein YjlB